MERKKVLVIKENLVLVINQNHLAMEDLASSRDGEKKSFGYKGKSSFGINQNHLAMEDRSSSSRDGFEKKSFGYKGKSSFGDKSKSSSYGRSSSVHQETERKKVLVLKENLVLGIN